LRSPRFLKGRWSNRPGRGTEGRARQDAGRSDCKTYVRLVRFGIMKCWAPSLVSIVITVPVPVVLTIPMVIVVEPPAIAIPIASKKLPSVMPGPNPMSARIGWTSPIPLMPSIAASRRVPVALNPDEVGSWSGWQHPDNTRRRRRPDSNSNRDLGEGRWAANDQCECQ